MELWSNKYAPRDLSEIKVNMDKRLLEALVGMKPGAVPHIIISGPPGCGKLTLARLFAVKRLNKYPANIKVVSGEARITKEERDAIKHSSYISRSKLGSAAGSSFEWPSFLQARAKTFIISKPLTAPYKIMVIREFHRIKNQESFRRIMEKYNHCRLVLTSSNPSAIIDPIVSRCVVFQLRKIRVSSFVDALSEAGSGEGISIPLDASKYLYSALEGNIGAALNTLQLAHATLGRIDKETLRKVSGTRLNTTFPLLQASFDRQLPLIKKHLDSLLLSMTPLELYRKMNAELSQQAFDDLGEVLQYMAAREITLLRCNDPRVQLLDILMGI